MGISLVSQAFGGLFAKVGDHFGAQLWITTILSGSTVLSFAAVAQANDALYLQQTVQGINVQNSDSTVLLRSRGAGDNSESLVVNCKNYQGEDFINLDCLGANAETLGNELRWQRAPENLLIPSSNGSDSLNGSPSETGELKIYL